MLEKENNKSSKTLEKALDILDLYCAGHNGLTLTEILANTDLTKTTAFRIIKTLEDRGYLYSDNTIPGFFLGAKVMHLSSVALANTDLQSMINPILKELCDIVKETTSVFVNRNNTRICIGRCESKNPLRNIVYVGEAFPVHVGAYGRILLMDYSDDEIKNIIRTNGLESITPFTITDENDFLDKIREARRDGYAVSYSERTMGTVAIAAPVYDFNNKIIATLGCSGPKERFTEENTQFIIENVIKYSKKLSQRLGWLEK